MYIYSITLLTFIIDYVISTAEILFVFRVLFPFLFVLQVLSTTLLLGFAIIVRLSYIHTLIYIYVHLVYVSIGYIYENLGVSSGRGGILKSLGVNKYISSLVGKIANI